MIVTIISLLFSICLLTPAWEAYTVIASLQIPLPLWTPFGDQSSSTSDSENFGRALNVGKGAWNSCFQLYKTTGVNMELTDKCRNLMIIGNKVRD